MKYLAELGRQTELSLAELESLFSHVTPLKTGVLSSKSTHSFGESLRAQNSAKPSVALATFESETVPDLTHLGGTLKIGVELTRSVLDELRALPEGKITLGVSDYRKSASKASARAEALKLKKILARHGRSVRVLENKSAVLSTATSHHNQLAEKKNHVEIMLTDVGAFRLLAVQNITLYAKRDQARPARDAKVGMLPPKLAQILLNLCGPLPENARVLDPFCGTGVVLQEALLMGYRVMGSDLSERMVDYSRKNLAWLSENLSTFQKSTTEKSTPLPDSPVLLAGDATSLSWPAAIDAVATEVFLGSPLSAPPAEIKLKTEKDTCKTIILDTLKNLAPQLKKDTPLVLAVPAWLRPNGSYSRLELLDEIKSLGYNVKSFKNLGASALLYHREGQVVARDIIVLRKS